MRIFVSKVELENLFKELELKLKNLNPNVIKSTNVVKFNAPLTKPGEKFL